jgi:hypothetical protein
MRKYLLPLIALLLPGIAHAQANQCRLPEIIARPQVEGPSADEPKRVLPIGYYNIARRRAAAPAMPSSAGRAMISVSPCMACGPTAMARNGRNIASRPHRCRAR